MASWTKREWKHPHGASVFCSLYSVGFAAVSLLSQALPSTIDNREAGKPSARICRTNRLESDTRCVQGALFLLCCFIPQLLNLRCGNTLKLPICVQDPLVVAVNQNQDKENSWKSETGNIRVKKKCKSLPGGCSCCGSFALLYSLLSLMVRIQGSSREPTATALHRLHVMPPFAKDQWGSETCATADSRNKNI